MDTGTTTPPDYDDAIVQKFIIATLVFGLVGMTVGLILALQLAWWPANLGLPWTTFGRLRPLHTNAVIFAFTGNFIFAGVYYSLQRLLKTRMFSDALSAAHFWGWQLIIVAAAITLPLGMSQGKEYAELIWPIDLAIAVVWVLFAVNFFGTIAIRKVKHLYVAIWFYLSMVITIAVLHIVNNLALPATLTRSYPVYAGMTDALVQWWYGHNAVGFLLTTPILGLMYYFLPKSVNRPVYSYRLSIIHFWALVFLYIWAGPHHLLYSALPDWAQTLGMVFSIMLIAPSWGGMLNGLLTLRGAWHRLRTDPIVKFWAVAITFYGMSTFEGPMMSIRAINALSHYTDWTIGHVHSGALGWVGMAAFAMLYWLVPAVWKRPLHSARLASAHFWLATVGILLYVVAMWVAGITQGLMWRAVDDAGQLVHPSFMDTVLQLIPFYWVRLLGGTLYLTGLLLALYNLYRTATGPAPQGAPSAVPAA
jgi:cytochrome c oxidase cbb3-type subunit I/II